MLCRFSFPFSPLHSEHSDAQLRYIDCCNTVLCAEYRQQTDRRYEVGKFLFASYCDKFNVHTSGCTERFKQCTDNIWQQIKTSFP